MSAGLLDQVEPPTAIEHAQERWAAYGLDLQPTEADGMWVGQCPTHRSEATVTVTAGTVSTTR